MVSKIRKSATPAPKTLRAAARADPASEPRATKVSAATAATSTAGRPLLLALRLIDEDPDQVRKVFDEASLKELAATIDQRGVKTPISVRPHPKHPGRYLINHGARRYRASRLAGRKDIPVYIDADYTADDQAIENLQRDNLSSREIAEYIDRQLKAGRKRTQIAKALGKAPSWVTKHLALLDLPAPIAQAFNSGALSDIELVYQLSVLHVQAPDEVTDWLAYNDANLTRDSLRKLQIEIDSRRTGTSATGHLQTVIDPAEDDGLVDAKDLWRPRLFVDAGDGAAELLVRRRPSDPSRAWLRYADGRVQEVPLTSIRLLALKGAATPS